MHKSVTPVTRRPAGLLWCSRFSPGLFIAIFGAERRRGSRSGRLAGRTSTRCPFSRRFGSESGQRRTCIGRAGGACAAIPLPAFPAAILPHPRSGGPRGSIARDRFAVERRVRRAWTPRHNRALQRRPARTIRRQIRAALSRISTIRAPSVTSHGSAIRPDSIMSISRRTTRLKTSVR